MPAFLANLPVWVLVLAGIVLAYIGYRYWKYKKANAYTPKVSSLQDTVFASPRDNPAEGK